MTHRHDFRVVEKVWFPKTGVWVSLAECCKCGLLKDVGWSYPPPFPKEARFCECGRLLAPGRIRCNYCRSETERVRRERANQYNVTPYRREYKRLHHLMTKDVITRREMNWLLHLLKTNQSASNGSTKPQEAHTGFEPV